jgi:hypothetical protein
MYLGRSKVLQFKFSNHNEFLDSLHGCNRLLVRYLL